jgi:anti-anti-sigma factor
MQFQIDGDDSRVSISGEFTFTDHSTFKSMVDRLFSSSKNTFVIDLSKLEFIDSAGLGMLLIARDEANKDARRLVLRAPRGQVKRIFDVTEFGTLFTIEA